MSPKESMLMMLLLIRRCKDIGRLSEDSAST